MKANTLISIQLISLALMIGCCESILDEFLPTMAFVVSFIIFAACSIYIGKNQKKIIRDTNRRYSKDIVMG